MSVGGLFNAAAQWLRWLMIVLFLNNISYANGQGSVDSGNLIETVEGLLSTAEHSVYQDVLQARKRYNNLQPQGFNRDQVERYHLLEVRILAYENKIEQAAQHVDDLINQSLSANNKASAYYLRARLYQVDQNYGQAFFYVNLAAQVPAGKVDVSNKMLILALAAELKMEQESYDEALEFASMALNIANTQGTLEQQCLAHDSMVYIHIHMQRVSVLEQLASSAIDICLQSKSYVMVVNLYSGMASVHKSQKNYVQLRQTIEKSIALQLKIGSIANLYRTRLSLVDVLIELNQLTMASSLLQALSLDEDITDRIADRRSYAKTASVLAEKQGNQREAIDQIKRYMKWQQRLHDEQNSSEFSYRSAQFSALLKQELSAFDLLTNEKERLYNKINSLGYQRLFLLTAIVLVLLSYATYTYRSNYKLFTVFDSQVDTLTNLYMYDDSTSYALAQKRLVYNPRQEYVAMVIDIDGFSAFNDNFGHAQGDRLLAVLAVALRHQYQLGGVILRKKDDVFVVLLANCSREKVAVMADQTLFCLHNFQVKNHTIDIRVNIGWYYHCDRDVSGAQEIDFGVNCAILALNHVKRALRGAAFEYNHDIINAAVTNNDPANYQLH